MLVLAQHANDINFRNLSAAINRVGNASQGIIVGMNEQVEMQQKRGIWLLVIGFSLIAIGSILNAISLMIE